MGLIDDIRKRTKNSGKKIILPESTEERTLNAIRIILKNNYCMSVLLGEPEEVLKKLKIFDVDKTRVEIYSVLRRPCFEGAVSFCYSYK